jgi:hypothetical protein
VAKKVTVKGKNGKTFQRTVYVRPEQPKAKPDKAAAKATSIDSAREIVRAGIKTPADAKALAGHLKGLTAKDIDALKAEHGLLMKGRLKQDKVDHLVAYAKGRGSVTADATPKAEPKAGPKAAPASKLPEVKSGAAKNPDDPAYVEAGRKMLADDGFRKDFANAYNDLSQLVEYKDGLVEMPRLYRAMKQAQPDLTVDQFHAAVDQVKRDRQAQVHVLNEVSTKPDAKNQGSIERNDRLYHYVRFQHGKGQEALANPDQMKPKGV